jgi:NAD(P)-dependent dehydrogenase (short-subunit alcohol dehydrogenase family)
MQLQGRVAIVTGGGYGIGKAIALALAQEGADVVVAARTLSALKKVAEEIENLGRKSLVLVTDLLQPDAPANMVEKVLKKFGKIDILVNNSGAEGPIKPVAEMDLKGWDDLLAVNLTGAMLCSRYVLEKSMIPRRSKRAPHAERLQFLEVCAYRFYPESGERGRAFRNTHQRYRAGSGGRGTHRKGF